MARSINSELSANETGLIFLEPLSQRLFEANPETTAGTPSVVMGLAGLHTLSSELDCEEEEEDTVTKSNSTAASRNAASWLQDSYEVIDITSPDSELDYQFLSQYASPRGLDIEDEILQHHSFHDHWSSESEW